MILQYYCNADHKNRLRLEASLKSFDEGLGEFATLRFKYGSSSL